MTAPVNIPTKIEVIIAVDPGETNGVAVLRVEDGHPLIMGQPRGLEGLTDWFIWYWDNYPNHEVVRMVIEDFTLMHYSAQKLIGSKLLTSQAIGVCSTEAMRRKIPITKQRPECKNTGAKWTKVSPVGSHQFSNQIDALNHGFYWLHTVRRIPIVRYVTSKR